MRYNFGTFDQFPVLAPEDKLFHEIATVVSHKEDNVIELATQMQLKLQDMVISLRKNLLERDEEGQDMIEYALLAALISIAAIAIIILVGPYLKNLFQDVVNAFGTAS